MNLRNQWVLGLSLLPLFIAIPARAADDAPEEALVEERAAADELTLEERVYLEERAERARHATDPSVRFELTMGFAGAYARYAELGLTGSTMLPPGTFEGGPAAGAAMAGLRYDARLVVSFVRMTVGGDLLWGLFDGQSRLLDEGGVPITITDRRIFDGVLRFGLGLEANLDGVRLFADLLGTLHFVEVAVERQGDAVTHTAVGFAPGLRLGVRLPIVDSFFVQLSADGSPFGPSYVGGDLSVGGAIE